MNEHLAECDRCASERRRLAGLPALLDSAQADDTIAPLSPQLEDAVLDRFVRERARAARPPRRVAARRDSRGAPWRVILAVVLALVLPGGGESAYARAELWSTSGKVLGNASAAEVDGGTRVQLRAHDLPVGGGAVYELWCVRTDGRWINGGSFQRARRRHRRRGAHRRGSAGRVPRGRGHAPLGRRRARRGGHARQAHLLNLLRAACVHQPCARSPS